MSTIDDMLAAGFTILNDSFRGAVVELRKQRKATRADIAAGNLAGAAAVVINVRAYQEDIPVQRPGGGGLGGSGEGSPRSIETMPGWFIGPEAEGDDVPTVEVGDILAVGDDRHTITKVVSKSPHGVHVLAEQVGARRVV